MKKPTPRQFLLLVIVAALIGVGIYFVTVTVKQTRAASDLETQIAEVDGQIASIENLYDIDTLKAELADLEVELGNVTFPHEYVVQNIDVHDLVIDAEDAAGVVIYSYIPDSPTTAYLNGDEDEGGKEYKAFCYELTIVASELSGLYNFLHEIESNASYQTLIINAIEIEYVPASESGSPFWYMACDVIVYAHTEQ